jgi:hypothetical protein
VVRCSAEREVETRRVQNEGGGGNQDKVLKGTELLAQEREEGSTRGKRKWKAGASEATPISLPRGPVAQET